jgi:hypothetical protein
VFKRREFFTSIGNGLETLFITWLGRRVTLTDDQVYAALAAMDMREMQVVMLRCVGLTVEEVARHEGYGATQVRLLTVSGLSQASDRLWPGGWRDNGGTAQRPYWATSRLPVSL